MRRLLLVLVLTFLPRVARADHDEHERIVDQTAYTLPARTFQLGLLRQEFAPVGWLQVGTYLAPWALRIPNGHLKLRLLGEDPVSVAVSVGFARFDPSNVIDDVGNAMITDVPVQLVASWRISDRWTVSPGAEYTWVGVHGSYDPANAHGVAALSNLQFFGTVEYRLTHHTAFVLHGRYYAFQHAEGRVTGNYRPDDFTTVHVDALASTDLFDFSLGFQVVPSVVFSWGAFNLRLGCGYGNFNIPGVNLILPNPGVVPDFDLYFRF